MPGNGAALGQRMESIAYLAGVTRQAGKRRYLSVGGDSPGRNFPDQIIDLLIAHGSGATFHPAGKKYEPGHNGDAAYPGRDRMLLFN
jgi:hypothetical protein